MIAARPPLSDDQATALRAQEATFNIAAPQGAADAEVPEQGRRLSGTVARLVPERGCGFIADAEERGYLRQRGAPQGVASEDLSPGTPVTFLVGTDPGNEPVEDLRALSIRSIAA